MDRPKAIYAGSFNPPTNGHKWVIDTAAKMFDLTVVIARNTAKGPGLELGQLNQTTVMLHAIVPVNRDLAQTDSDQKGTLPGHEGPAETSPCLKRAAVRLQSTRRVPKATGPNGRSDPRSTHPKTLDAA